jgi:hypothetical protein
MGYHTTVTVEHPSGLLGEGEFVGNKINKVGLTVDQVWCGGD